MEGMSPSQSSCNADSTCQSRSDSQSRSNNQSRSSYSACQSPANNTSKTPGIPKLILLKNLTVMVGTVELTLRAPLNI